MGANLASVCKLLTVLLHAYMLGFTNSAVSEGVLAGDALSDGCHEALEVLQLDMLLRVDHLLTEILGGERGRGVRK